MIRTIRVHIGDVFHDGHGHFQRVQANISGKDVSDEALKTNYEKNKAALGFGLEDVFDGYDESVMTPDVFDALVDAGFMDFHEKFAKQFEVCFYAETEKHPDVRTEELDYVAFVMFMIGHGIEYFGYQEFPDLKVPNIIDSVGISGGQVGYGLFYS